MRATKRRTNRWTDRPTIALTPNNKISITSSLRLWCKSASCKWGSHRLFQIARSLTLPFLSNFTAAGNKFCNMSCNQLQLVAICLPVSFSVIPFLSLSFCFFFCHSVSFSVIPFLFLSFCFFLCHSVSFYVILFLSLSFCFFLFHSVLFSIFVSFPVVLFLSLSFSLFLYGSTIETLKKDLFWTEKKLSGKSRYLWKPKSSSEQMKAILVFEPFRRACRFGL